MKKREEGQPEVLNRKIKGLAGLYHGVYSGSAVSDNEFWVWYTLVTMDGDHSQQDICTLWSLPKQTVNTIIRRMVRRGLAVLEVVPGTRNRKIIRLTEAGREYGETVVKPVSEAEQRAFRRMPEEDQVRFLDVMSKYVDMLKEELRAAAGGAVAR